MKLFTFRILWIGMMVSAGISSCGKTTETASKPSINIDKSDQNFELDSTTPDSSVWPLGRQASYSVDIKCGDRFTTVSGSNSKFNGIVLPPDATKCIGVLKSVKLGQRVYTPVVGVTEADFIEGGKVEFVEKSNQKDFLGVVVEKQISLDGVDSGSLVFRFTGITDRRKFESSPDSFSMRSIFVQNIGKAMRADFRAVGQSKLVFSLPPAFQQILVPAFLNSRAPLRASSEVDAGRINIDNFQELSSKLSS